VLHKVRAQDLLDKHADLYMSGDIKCSVLLRLSTKIKLLCNFLRLQAGNFLIKYFQNKQLIFKFKVM